VFSKMTLTIQSLSELPSTAKNLIASFGSHRVIAFKGPMGAGKTTLIKAICEQMGVKDTVSSPTFSLVNEYRSSSGEKIFHFDFYRIKNESEAYDMGYEDYLYSGAWCFIEWPERIGELLPADALTLEIRLEGEKRIAALK
jgi:tRNA threonylcarbamoyladenosine biosynthesis protein TsaE